MLFVEACLTQAPTEGIGRGLPSSRITVQKERGFANATAAQKLLPIGKTASCQAERGTYYNAQRNTYEGVIDI